MESEILTASEREAIRAELQQVFDERAAEVLIGVVEQVVAHSKDGGVVHEDFRELKHVVAELAAAQVRTEQRIEELAAAQTRTERRLDRLIERVDHLAERMEELATAQTRTEQRLDRLTERMEELAAAQARTEYRLEELAAAQTRTERAVERLSKQVGGLSETVGGDIKDIAYIVLHDVLKRELGWEVGVLERTWQRWGREPEEVNVFGQATDPARPGQVIWIVGEAKHNLTIKEVERFVRQVERARRHLTGEILPVCFCYRARPEVQERVREVGLRLVFSYGKLV